MSYNVSMTIDDSDFERKITEMQKQLDSLTRRLEQAGISADTSFARIGQSAANGMKQAEESIDSLDRGLDKLGKAAAAMGVAFGAKELIDGIVNTRAEFQKLEVAFETMLGSQGEANKLMNQMVQTAATTPFELQDVANGAKQLLAYGASADSITGTLTQLGDIAAGLSIPLNDLTYLYGTTMTQGRLFTEDFNQFTSRGIPMVRELADMFDVAEGEVKGLVEAGMVGFPEVQKVIERLTTKGGQFAGLMEAQSKTIGGQISNLGDSISSMFNAIGESNEGVISDVISGLSWMVEHYKEVGTVLGTLVGSYGVAKGAVLAFAAAQKASAAMAGVAKFGEVIKAFKAVSAATSAATRAQLLHNAAVMANPYILAAGAIAAVTAGLVMFARNADTAARAQDELNDRMSDEIDNAVDLFEGVKNAKAGTDEYRKAVDKLKSAYPGLIDQYINAKGELTDLAGAQAAVLKAVEERIAREIYLEQQSAAVKERLNVKREQWKDFEGEHLDDMAEAYMKQGMDQTQAKAAAREKINEIRDLFYAELDKAFADGKSMQTGDFGRMFTKQLKGIELPKDFRKSLWGGSNDMIKIVTTYRQTARDLKKAREGLEAALGKPIDTSGNVVNPNPEGNNGEGEKAQSLLSLWSQLGEAQAKLQLMRKQGNAAGVAEAQQVITSTQAEIEQKEKLINTEKELGDERKRINDALGDTQKYNEAGNAQSGYTDDYQWLQQRAAALKEPEAKSSTGDAEAKDADKAAKAAAAAAKAKRDEELKLQSEMRKAEEERQMLELSGISDIYQRKRAEIELTKQSELAAIDEQQRRAIAAAMDKAGDTRQMSDLKEGEGTAMLSADALAVFDAKRDNVEQQAAADQSKLLADMLGEYQTYWEKRRDIAARGVAMTEAVQQSSLSDGDKAAKQAEIDFQIQQQQDQLDLQYAQRSDDFSQWMQNITDLTETQLKKALQDAKAMVDALGDAAGPELRAKIVVLEKQLKKTGKETKDWKGWNSTMADSVDLLGDIAGAVASVGTEEARLAAQMITTTASVIGNVAKLVNASAEGSAAATTDATAKMKAMETASVVLAIISAAIQLATAVFNAFSKGKDMSGLIQFYDTVNSVLDGVIARQEKIIENATADTVAKETEKLNDYLRQQEEYARKAAEARLQHRSSNAHSISYRTNQWMREGGWNEDLTALLGKRITSAYDLVRLSSADLLKLQTQRVDFWGKLDETLRKELETIIATGQSLEEAEMNAKKQLVGFDADALVDTYRSALDDMEGTSESFAADFEEQMREAIINALVWDADTEASVRKIYEEIAAILGSASLSDSEKAARVSQLKQQVQGIYDQAAAERDALLGIAGISGDAARSADSAGFESMSQETADELNGRFTAIQGYVYTINQTIAQGLQLKQSIAGDVRQMTDMLSIVAQNVGDIAARSAQMAADIASMQTNGIRLREE